MKLKTLIVNGIIAALYIAVTFFIQPFGFTNIQFRLSEIFNHLIVFNKKYFFGIVLGVFLANLFFSQIGVLDLIFGTGQSALALSVTILTARFVDSIKARMIINTIVFTITMFLIAIELNIVFELPFFLTWLTTAIGEFAVMLIGIPIMLYLHKRVNFTKLIEK
ncbi:QueT transporter family protein [Bacillaceae bacterium Marseille-Q3522]|nr:QueT transporter family protein [Bacillaceae bacterium Marseille-Q3522]